jgi:hypothetical protein
MEFPKKILNQIYQLMVKGSLIPETGLSFCRMDIEIHQGRVYF